MSDIEIVPAHDGVIGRMLSESFPPALKFVSIRSEAIGRKGCNMTMGSGVSLVTA